MRFEVVRIGLLCAVHELIIEHQSGVYRIQRVVYFLRTVGTLPFGRRLSDETYYLNRPVRVVALSDDFFDAGTVFSDLFGQSIDRGRYRRSFEFDDDM